MLRVYSTAPQAPCSGFSPDSLVQRTRMRVPQSGVAHLPQKRSNMKLGKAMPPANTLPRFAALVKRGWPMTGFLMGGGGRKIKKKHRINPMLPFGDPTGTATRVARCIKRPYVALLQGPLDRTLTGFSSPDTKNRLAKRQSGSLVTRRGLEPRTHCLKGSCSTG